MKPRLKICCISSLAEAELAVAAGADALGLVGDMPSGPGVLDDDTIRLIAREVPPPVATFLLTREREAGHIAEHMHYCGCDTVQIVNHVDPGEHVLLAEQLPDRRRVQVIHVEDEWAPRLIERYADRVHAFLLDSGRPSAALPELGGTGRVHDWSISARFVEQSPRPVFLAGGLSPANVTEAIAQVAPFGLDICSGVRVSGALDESRLREYVAAVHRART
ncbi:phosphoribosylanthranilate isomerase [Kushneria sinocarnis]|uniref:N-(5'-phosphoribosyl)anthranilate isomerase n=1 Tax=Kushneria sinocarnis TaxID=595502 RepID=A0A420WU95_9GAMM|nr:phosphoribosylanthranilate isomerase [Kushneria sinocarnis]RKQ97013.1 phosphoribosylanthranilate isomerase [Kushneria sinocarnis]